MGQLGGRGQSSAILWTYIVFILHNFVIMEVKTCDQRAQKSSICYHCMSPRDPRSGECNAFLGLWRHIVMDFMTNCRDALSDRVENVMADLLFAKKFIPSRRSLGNQDY